METKLNNKKRIVIIGATSAMAEHCARLWVQGGAVDLVLVARDRARTERVAADLRVRNPQTQVEVVTSGFIEAAEIEETVRKVWGAGVDLVLIAHGVLPDQGECQQDLAACRAALDVNALSPVLFAEAFAQRMATRKRGTIAVIGSVAGDRGRKSNYVYGAAKGLVDRYLQGLRHRFAGSGVKVAIIKPGPTDTPMTAHLKGSAKLAPVEDVARDIVDALARGKEVIYAPGKWRLIMLIIRHLPGFVFNKMNI
jgi:decaprenylphospho-beta-D-erythro-pentofuranosid-2-ulose 2-reductase